MHIANLKNSLVASVLLMAGVISTGCTLVTDDLEPCPAQLRVKFVYDYNLKWGDAFTHEVTSVNVWAFDSAGRFVWSDSAAGEVLASGDFYFDTPLDEGTYDFVAWCGLDGNDDFTLATYTPASKEELEVAMRTVEQGGEHLSSVRLGGLYHAQADGVSYAPDPSNPTIQEVTLSLMKDTKDIRVHLQHLDGSPIENRDFSVSITDANSMYAWNNDLLTSPVVTYEPWNTRYGVMDPSQAGGSEIASLLFELSTGRLMEDADAILTVHRDWDNRDIIRIPLVKYLLLVKGHYGDISDQEYLDRQDDYSMTFFIDPASNWYSGAGIFINGWTVVPPQSQDF